MFFGILKIIVGAVAAYLAISMIPAIPALSLFFFCFCAGITIGSGVGDLAYG